MVFVNGNRPSTSAALDTPPRSRHAEKLLHHTTPHNLPTSRDSHTFLPSRRQIPFYTAAHTPQRPSIFSE